VQLLNGFMRARMRPLPNLSGMSFLSSSSPQFRAFSSSECRHGPRISCRRHSFEPIEASLDIAAGDTRAWIFTIVRSCYHSWLTGRRRKSRSKTDHGEGDSEELISNISSEENNPEATLLREAQSKTVCLVLDAMPRPLREILALRKLEELSYGQISDITDLPIGTVMSRLARARRAFGDGRRETENGA
jgi:RNA polymerase sigma factor (sigma-70 family)